MRNILLNLLLIIITFSASASHNICEYLLFPKKTLTKNKNSTFTAKNYNFFDNKIISKTTSTIKNSQYYLTAGSVILDKNNNNINANKGVMLQNHDIQIIANKAFLSKPKQYFKKAKFQFLNNVFNGTADEIEILQNNKIQFTNINISGCNKNNIFWHLKSKNMEVNLTDYQVYANDPFFKINNKTIIILPSIKWYLKGKHSGFLIPSIKKTNKYNFEFSFPYYFSLAEYKDLLLTTNIRTNGSIKIDNNYRHLLENGDIDIKASYLWEEKKINDWYINSYLNYIFNKNNKIKFKYSKISNKNYLKETQLDNYLDNITSYAEYIFQKNNLRLNILIEKNQILNNKASVYSKKPKINLFNTFGINKYMNIGVNLEWVKFKNNNILKEQGIRMHSNIFLSTKNIYNNYFLKSKINFKSTIYNTHILQKKKLHTRDILSFSLDNNWQFFKNTNNYTINIKPRIFYIYTPYTNQQQIPIFDTKVKKISNRTLFSDNSFIGIDRIKEANDIALGLKTEFINKNKNNILGINSSIRYYGKSNKSKKYSNLITEIQLKKLSNILNTNIHWNSKENIIEQKSLSWQYIWQKKKKIRIFFYDDIIKNNNALELAFIYPLNHLFSMYSILNYSPSYKRKNSSSIGIIYQSCCWSLNMKYTDKINNPNEKDTEFSIKFSLKGLGNDNKLFNNLDYFLKD